MPIWCDDNFEAVFFANNNIKGKENKQQEMTKPLTERMKVAQGYHVYRYPEA